MSVLVTTATEGNIIAHLKDASSVIDNTEFQDMERSFEEEGETFHIFVLRPGRWKSDIEKAIKDGGKKFRWL